MPLEGELGTFKVNVLVGRSLRLSLLIGVSMTYRKY